MTYALPPLSWLRAFEATARHHSFTSAAAELNLTQAAVSKQVKNLVVANYTPANVEEEGTNVEQEKGATQEAPTQSPQAKAIIESVVKETKFSETAEYKSLIETVEGLKAELSKLTEENTNKFSAVAGSIETLTNEVVEMSKPMDKVKHSPEKNTKSEVVELSKQEISNMSVSNRIKYFQNKLKK